MCKSRSLEDLVYIEKRKLEIIIISLISAFIIVGLLFKNHTAILIYIIKMSMVVSSFSVLLVLRGTKRFERDRFFHYFRNLHFIIIIANFPVFGLNNYLIYGKEIILDVWKNQNLFFIIIYFIFLREIFHYISNKEYTKDFDFFSVSAIIFSFIFLVNFTADRYIFEIIFLICFIISIRNIFYVSKYKLLMENKVNYMYIFAISTLIKTAIQLLNFTFGFDVGMSFFYGFLNFININMIAIIIVDKLLNDSYNSLFTELYSSSKELKKINREILEKNEELEFSQSKIREIESTTKNILKNLPIPLAIISEESKRIIYANGEFIKILSKNNLRDLINTKIFDFLEVESMAIFNEDTVSRLTRCYLKDLRGRDKHLTLEVIDRNKENGEIILSLIDITSKIQINEMKDNIKENSLKQNVRKNFLSNISHDLKTPINVIYSAMQLEPMFIQKKDKKSLLKYNKIAKKNCSLLINLTNNIIDIGRLKFDKENIILREVEFVSFVEDIVQNLVCYSREKKIELLFDTDSEEVLLNIDKSTMNRVIMNLISNSIKFTEYGGRILILLSCSDEEVVLTIEDNGIGMSENVLKNIFKRYNTEGNTGKVIEKGSGIGLNVVKNLVEIQGGEIQIESKLGEGTRVYLTFKRKGVKNKRDREIS